eukprot:1380833-Amorphochlora_amoeboformis.AAC.1
MRIKELKLCCDFKRDESYTPNKISIRAGTGFHDLREVQVVELDEPDGSFAQVSPVLIFLSPGWVVIDLTTKASDGTGNVKILRAHVVQIAILSSHQNGRDTHVRQ